MGYQDENGVLSDGQQAHTPARLFDAVRRRLRVKHYSLATERIYLQWIRRFIAANDRRHPREMGGADVEIFLTEMAVVGGCRRCCRNRKCERCWRRWRGGRGYLPACSTVRGCA